jgi:pyruvate,water dikinase
MITIVELKNNLSAREVGGKGYSLGVLAKNDFYIPKGFIITARSFFEFLKYNSIIDKIETLSSRINRENFEQKSKEIRSLILEGETPKDLILEIKYYLNKLNVRYVSVRSSAVSEDSLKSSFAGLYDTFLNTKSEPKLVLICIKKCWASLFNERAVVYRLRKGIPQLESMAVVAQEMIPAEVSGTAFTAHPDTGDRNIIVIESSWGLGEAIVSGLVTPDCYIVEKRDLKIVKQVLGRKKIMIEAIENGTVRRDTPPDKMSEFCLNNSMIENLAKICLAIEKILKYPQDIEWCTYKDRIWILQSRSLTSLQGNPYNKEINKRQIISRKKYKRRL